MIFDQAPARFIPGSRTVVIIDMQTGYPGSGLCSAQATIREMIRAAKAQGDAIIIVRMKGAGATQPFIMMDLRDEVADRFAEGVKTVEDGSSVVARVCANRRFPTGHFQVAGCYAGVCVKATVLGLVKAFPDARVDVVKNGCIGGEPRDFDDPVPEYRWGQFPTAPNIHLI